MTPMEPDAETFATRVADAFERIHCEQMAGLPLLNTSLAVAALGFQVFEGRMLGMVVTPWMMNLVLFPGPDDHWEGLKLGDKTVFLFPGGACRCMANAIDGLGALQMYSVHSPMRGFHSQQSAVEEAERFLRQLLSEPPADAEAPDPVDEALLGRILRGEHVPEVEAVVDAATRAQRQA